jgi:hypothetical protein
MCELDFDGYCEVWDESIIKKARKQHRCDSCGGTIEKGSSYIKHFSIFEGSVTSDKMCNDCDDDRTAFSKEHGNMLPAPSGFKDVLYDCIGAGHGWKELLRWKRMLKRMDNRKTTPRSEVRTDE